MDDNGWTSDRPKPMGQYKLKVTWIVIRISPTSIVKSTLDNLANRPKELLPIVAHLIQMGHVHKINSMVSEDKLLWQMDDNGWDLFFEKDRATIPKIYIPTFILWQYFCINNIELSDH
jgi:hypothetical protein